MATGTGFPTSIDSFTNKLTGEIIGITETNKQSSAIEALEAKVGADSSAVTSSHDYKLAHTVNDTGTQTVAGVKTFSSAPIMSALTASRMVATGTSKELVSVGSWTAYAPTITASVGTITTATASGLYRVMGNITEYIVNITITTNGTGSTILIFTLPSTASANSTYSTIGYGREFGLTGKSCQVGNYTTTQRSIAYYDASYPGADGAQIQVTGWYLQA